MELQEKKKTANVESTKYSFIDLTQLLIFNEGPKTADSLSSNMK